MFTKREGRGAGEVLSLRIGEAEKVLPILKRGRKKFPTFKCGA